MTPSPGDVDDPAERPVTRAGYGVSLAICLPRDELSVPVIRHLVRYTLDQVGVLDAVSSDIEVALTEACANVLDHAGPGDSYEVTVAVGSDLCELRVVDVGHGFDYATVQSDSPTHDWGGMRPERIVTHERDLSCIASPPRQPEARWISYTPTCTGGTKTHVSLHAAPRAQR